MERRDHSRSKRTWPKNDIDVPNVFSVLNFIMTFVTALRLFVFDKKQTATKNNYTVQSSSLLLLCLLFLFLFCLRDKRNIFLQSKTSMETGL